jgi:Bacterial regulatory proteins, luxR family
LLLLDATVPAVAGGVAVFGVAFHGDAETWPLTVAPDKPPAAVAELTEREHENLRPVARGLTNAEIAGRLLISPLTTKPTSAASCASSTAATALNSSRSPTKAASSPPATRPRLV